MEGGDPVAKGRLVQLAVLLVALVGVLVGGTGNGLIWPP